MNNEVKGGNKSPPDWFVPSEHRLHCFGHLQIWTAQIFGLQLKIETEIERYSQAFTLSTGNLIETSEVINRTVETHLAQVRGHRSIQELRRLYITNRLTMDKFSDQQIQVVLSCHSLDLAENLLQSIMWLLPWIYRLLLCPRPLNKFVKI